MLQSSRSLVLLLFSGIFTFSALFTSCRENTETKAAVTTPKIDSFPLYGHIPELHLKLDSLFLSMHKRGRFNGNVLVARQGRILYERSLGYSDLQSKEALKPSSLFQLASVSKQFTAVAILQLYEQGKLNLEDSLQKFFPEFPYRGISVHDLLTHRSGLPNYMYFCDHMCSDKVTPIYNADVLELMRNNRPQAYYYPKRKYSYSNTGYCLLASIVEQVSGESFRSYVRKNIFQPLGMDKSFLLGETITDSSLLTYGHFANKRKAGHDFLDGVCGDKGVYSNLLDLYRWDQGLYTNKIIKQETLDLAFHPYNPDLRGDENYGYGWRILNTHNDDRIVYHGGLWHGYQPYFVRRINDQTTVIVLSNHTAWEIRNVKKILGMIDQVIKRDSGTVSDTLTVHSK